MRATLTYFDFWMKSLADSGISTSQKPCFVLYKAKSPTGANLSAGGYAVACVLLF